MVQRPPLLGEHTDGAAGALCGVAAEEVAQLRERGVV